MFQIKHDSACNKTSGFRSKKLHFQNFQIFRLLNLA